MRTKRLAIFAFTLFLLLLVSPAFADQDPNVFVQGEATLEGRLLAPCCWTQTLDVHESELARTLRAEIRRRLQGGESAAVIEDDIVSRYGEKIRAVPKGKSLTAMGVWLSIVIAIAGLGAIGLVVRWVRRGRAKLRRDESAPTAQAAASDAYDERLDAELRELDN